MRIIIAGAGGFIGGRIAIALISAGHEVIVCGRRPERLPMQFPSNKIVQCDFAADTVEHWRERLAGVDAVVNAAGIFRGKDRNSFEAVRFSPDHEPCSMPAPRQA